MATKKQKKKKETAARKKYPKHTNTFIHTSGTS